MQLVYCSSIFQSWKKKHKHIQITSEFLHIRCVYMEVNKIESLFDS